ncbi:TolB family protein [Bifidobacterium catulorum]|uniref:Biopolymer transporter Tol n=1 Tax=Bifidobacterium catulorum TaxID=1630173 RepID=A0A2U2MSS9_9BIFI|nr:PD40 domain-containing protein [Bifidobacterium catulorum]PWG59906.1 biopolymer transporter Tol [Bifidobacterium catulorum]
MTIPSTHHDGLKSPRWPGRQCLQPGQIAQLRVIDVETREETVLLESDMLIESPNWTPDGEWIIVNAKGRLYRLPADGSGMLERIPIDNVPWVNNDHVLSPDGKRIYFSAEGHLYVAPVTGGDARKVSNDHPEIQEYSYWLHGISPDEKTLAYVSTEPEGSDPHGRRNLGTIPAHGGPDFQMTDGVNDFDGPEYSRDGQWIYYNSEEAATCDGHAQIFRRRPDGSERQQLTFDDRINWFPHFAPDGSKFVYISYEPGLLSHPADTMVELRMMDAEGGEPETVTTLFGGQGTINTNTWAPDGRRFAFIAYPSAL